VGACLTGAGKKNGERGVRAQWAGWLAKVNFGFTLINITKPRNQV
jgi:hypothetical protein